LTAPVRLALALAILVSCRDDAGRGGGGVVLAQPAESEIDFGEVGRFELTERSGRTVTREDLLGRPWIAAFIFTRCTGPCPRVTATQRALQDRLAGTRACIVSFSVDPEWDTPERLRAYADGAGASPERWLFLTGDAQEIDRLIRESFLSPVERAPEAPIGQHVSHRTQLVVVDARGRLRGFYAGESDTDLDRIVARVRYLEREAAHGAPVAPGAAGGVPPR
jgi:cytochrome oxidase Cu insertion factor (SCO1/SenC/PrrC family)